MLAHVVLRQQLKMESLSSRKTGFKEGDWIYIETRRGKIKQMLSLDPDLDPRVVVASFGWWFPEEPSTLYGWNKSNLNMLTESAPSEPAVGSPQLRGIPCRVFKA